MVVLATCGNCGKTFTCNSKYVPTVNKIPVCKECVEWANPIRIKAGLESIPVHPEAYEPEEVM